MADRNIEFEDQADFGDEMAEPPKSTFKKKMSFALAGSGVALTFIALAAVIVVVAGAVGLKGMFVKPEPAAQSQMKAAPRDSGAAPTGEDATEAYKDRVREENVRRTEAAKESGESSVRTLLEGPVRRGEGCDEQCQARLEQMIQRQDQRLNQLAQALAKAPQEVPDNAYMPDRIVYDGGLYMSEGEQAARTSRMQQEIEVVAQAMSTSLSGHGFASTHGQATERSSGGPRQGGTYDGPVGDGAGGPSGDPVSGSESPMTALIAQAETRYATLDMTANSDVPGPIRATVHQGTFAGSKALGQFEKMDNYLVIRFTSLTTPEDSKTLPPGRTYPIDAIAVNESTRMVGMADKVDRHLFLKTVAIGGAAFLQGFGDAFAQAGSTTITGGGNTVVTHPRLTLEDKTLAALGEVGRAAGRYLEPYANRPTTIIKYADTGFAMLFLKPVVDENN